MNGDDLKYLHLAALSARNVLHDYIIDHQRRFAFYDVSNLQGVCGSGSILVASVLREFGFTRQLCIQQFYYPGQNNGCHCWTRLNDEYFVDVTATQFGGPKVYVSKRKPYTDTMEQAYAMVVSTMAWPYVDIEALYSEMIDFFGWPQDELLNLDEVSELTDMALQEYEFQLDNNIMAKVAWNG